MPEAEKVHLPPQTKKEVKMRKNFLIDFFFLFLMFRLKKYLTIHAKILNWLDMKHFRTSTRYIITITGNFSVISYLSKIFSYLSRFFANQPRSLRSLVYLLVFDYWGSCSHTCDSSQTYHYTDFWLTDNVCTRFR